MPPALIVCPSCACHAKSSETRCPTCDRPLRREDGGASRTAVAVLLGLTAASALAANACGTSTPVTFYGGAQTGGSPTTSETTSTTSTTTTGTITFTTSTGSGGSDGG